ncbi:Peptidase S28 domain containing protein [Trichuris trichiura]|uniref:Peptidase S28 domain containing protein n=1 Tax=Trichuris trichiura TaxID=36087 RepID=A0A077ZCE4_TRITR|nr:Peptidase S28 domain containing protein [Trichuris trichiura]
MISVVFCMFTFVCTVQPVAAYTWNESWYDAMPVDHFSYDMNVTFRLRYLINTERWHSNFGPMFFYCGNEGSVEGFAQNAGFIWDSAKAFNAMVVFAEHRYYGKSLPFGNMSRYMLGKLSSSQALADFAVLISHLKSTFASAVYLPVIAFGGSYGGMLAAWMRIKYPHLIDGALAASAPVAQFPGLTPCSTFTDITTTSAFALRSSLCNESDLAFKNNVTQLVNWLSDIYSTLAMVNYPYENDFLNPVPGWPVKASCTVLTSSPFTFNYESHAIYKAVSVYVNYTGAVSCNRLQTKTGSTVDAQKLYAYLQSCTEMVMPMCNSRRGMFERSEWNETEFGEKCFRKFGVQPSRDWAVANYGGRSLSSVTNIVFSNGWLDPWRGGGILSSDHGIASLIVEDGAHHYDLRGLHPKDTPSVINVRLLEISFIRKWLQQTWAKRKRFDLERIWHTSLLVAST